MGDWRRWSRTIQAAACSLAIVLCIEPAAAETEPEIGGVDDTPFIDDTPALRNVEHPDWFKLSFLDLAEDLAEAVADGKKGLIVYFGQKHCPYCQALMQVNLGMADIVRYTREHFDVIEIDIWGSRNVTDLQGRVLSEREYAVAEKTNFTPSMLFYDAEGREAFRMTGYFPPYKFRAALEFVVEGYYLKESFADYLARATEHFKAELTELNEQAFFQRPPHALDRSRFAADRPLVVFFEQRDCHACDILHTGPLAEERTLELIDGFDVVQLDMWSDAPVLTPDGRRLTASQWARSLGIFYSPTLVFFDEHGREIIRVDSVVRLYRLQGVLEYVGTKGYLEAPTYQLWRKQNRVPVIEPPEI
jgi:thioredoxin-related protein